MANFNFYIKDEGVDRILFIENASSQKDIERVEETVVDLLSACEARMLYWKTDEGPYISLEEYDADIEYAAARLEATLGCSLRNSSPYVWYINDDSIKGSELPIVWNTSTDDDTFYAVVVQGNVINLAKVPLWGWNIANGPWTENAETTQKAYKAVQGETKDEATGERYGNRDFSFNVWNDLCEKVKAMLDAVYSSTGDPTFVWDDTYATYNDTLMSEDDRYLSADRFNSLRFNIGIHESTGIGDVVNGQEVKMWYFETLADCVNALINKHGLNEE